jgi:hypothetical protein
MLKMADVTSKERRKNWARLIQKIYEVDPLICPKYSVKMKVISLIEDEDVIGKILNHLGSCGLSHFFPASSVDTQTPYRKPFPLTGSGA